MENFSIKDIENLTGIKAHTLRIWEKRYNLIVSKRKDSNHRFFDNEDLKSILRITYLYETDFRISQIAKLSKEAIFTFTDIDYSNSKSTEAYILQLINSIIEYNSNDFEKIFNAAVNQYGFELAIAEVAYGLLRRIGLLWLTEYLIPAQEHFASNLIRSFLIKAIDELPNSTIQNSEETILFTPLEEYHEIPLLYAQWLFKKNGKKTFYLGVNVSVEEIKYCTGKRNISNLFFHIITNLTGKNLNEYVQELITQFPDQKLIVSSPQAKNISFQSPNLITIHSLEELRLFPARFRNQE